MGSWNNVGIKMFVYNWERPKTVRVLWVSIVRTNLNTEISEPLMPEPSKRGRNILGRE